MGNPADIKSEYGEPLKDKRQKAKEEIDQMSAADIQKEIAQLKKNKAKLVKALKVAVEEGQEYVAGLEGSAEGKRARAAYNSVMMFPIFIESCKAQWNEIMDKSKPIIGTMASMGLKEWGISKIDQAWSDCKSIHVDYLGWGDGFNAAFKGVKGHRMFVQDAQSAVKDSESAVGDQ